MTNLIPLPYDTRYKGAPANVALMLRACQLAGHNIPVDDGWRDYADQKALRIGWEKGLPGYNYASDPDDPNAQNNHLRGEAWDIVNRSDRQYMLAAGFTPDGSEWWHFNEPSWRNYPIIKTDDSTGVAAVTAITLNSRKQGKTVNFYKDTSGTIFYGTVPIKSMADYTLLVRYEKSSADKLDTFNAAERDIIINRYLKPNGLKA